MKKITLEQYKKLVDNPETSEETIANYSIADPSEGGLFNPVFIPNPELVTIPSPIESELENAMAIGNAFARNGRKIDFEDRQDDSPVIVSEGDSWFQFPVLIKEVIDHLNDNYLVWDVSAAGDTADNMVFGPAQKKGREFMLALQEQKQTVKAFLFSGAGNDVIGQDVTGRPVISGVLFDYQLEASADSLVDHEEYDIVLSKLNDAYRNVISSVRAEPGFEELPILIHGYDYVIPGGFSGDPRRPIYAKKDQWLGKPMKRKGIVDTTIQREIIVILIDKLYETLSSVASSDPNVHLVDCRGTLPDVSEWNDEIHPTSKGFKKITQHFKNKLISLNIQ